MESVTKIKHYARKKPKQAMHLSAMLILVLNLTTWSPIHRNTKIEFSKIFTLESTFEKIQF